MADWNDEEFDNVVMNWCGFDRFGKETCQRVAIKGPIIYVLKSTVTKHFGHFLNKKTGVEKPIPAVRLEGCRRLWTHTKNCCKFFIPITMYFGPDRHLRSKEPEPRIFIEEFEHTGLLIIEDARTFSPIFTYVDSLAWEKANGGGNCLYIEELKDIFKKIASTFQIVYTEPYIHTWIHKFPYKNICGYLVIDAIIKCMEEPYSRELVSGSDRISFQQDVLNVITRGKDLRHYKTTRKQPLSNPIRFQKSKLEKRAIQEALLKEVKKQTVSVKLTRIDKQ